MGRGGDGMGAARQRQQQHDGQSMELLLRGNLYEVGSMLTKHPGGSVIKLYAGQGIDATAAFNSFHLRSATAEKWLASLPCRPAPAVVRAERLPGQSALMADFTKLEQDLRAEGLFEPSPVHIALRLLELAGLHALGLGLLLLAASGWWKALGILLLGIGSGRCGWLMHEGGHYSLTGKIGLDKTLQVWLYGVGCGMSAGWWRSQHNRFVPFPPFPPSPRCPGLGEDSMPRCVGSASVSVWSPRGKTHAGVPPLLPPPPRVRHHAMPQKEGSDPDLNTLPLVAFTARIVKSAGVPTRLWLRAQAVLFPVITCLLVALGWQVPPQLTLIPPSRTAFGRAEYWDPDRGCARARRLGGCRPALLAPAVHYS